MRKLSLNKKALTLVVAVIAILLVVTAPAALAWQQGPSSDWWYINAQYEDDYVTGPLVIELDGDSSAGQTFHVGDTVNITCYVHAYAVSCAGWANEAYTSAGLQVTGPSDVGSDTAGGYDYSDSCAEVDTEATLAIAYTLTAAGTHQVDMNSNVQVAQYGSDVADETVDASLTFEVLPTCESIGEELEGTCDPTAEWRNHGAYVSCAAVVVDGYLEAGLIDEETASCIMNPIARSDVGKPSKDP